MQSTTMLSTGELMSRVQRTLLGQKNRGPVGPRLLFSLILDDLLVARRRAHQLLTINSRKMHRR